MDYRKFGETYLVRMDKGRGNPHKAPGAFGEGAHPPGLCGGLGAVNDFTVGVLRTAAKQYEAHNFTGDHEIVSLTGTVSTMNGGFYAHLHMSAAGETGAVVGGHLNRAVISATCEMVLRLLDGRAERRFDPETGLNLFQFE